MTNHAGEIVRGIFTFALIIGAVGFVVVRSVLKAEDPARMILKWLVTLGVAVFMIWVAIPAVLQDGYAALHGLSLVLICAVVMVVTWRHNLASLVADPIGALYDGGTTPPDPHPAYSVALARQKQGRYLEAIAEIRKQLDRFPTDVEGQLLLAQIQAEDLKDLPAADRTRRVLAYELIVANGAVRNLIRENNVHQLENTIQTGRKEGMTLMDNCLYDLYCKCLITYDTALSRARHPDHIIRKKT